METRNVALTLDKAREFYSRGGFLAEIALQAYTKEELTIPEWQNIKTFEDACKALGITNYQLNLHIEGTCNVSLYKHNIAIFKLDIIRKALNGDWKPSLTRGPVFHPYVKIYPATEASEAARIYDLSIGRTFITDGDKYTLLGGSTCRFVNGICHCYEGRNGVTDTDLSLTCCKSKEIAEHMSRYFSEEIFEACYVQYEGSYQWV